MSSRKNYPPAPLVVATTASGAKVDGHVRICHGAFVGASLAWLWLWRWLGWTERCNTAQCIDANMLSSRAWRELHFSCLPLHGACAACIMHHAACCMMHLARKANGSTWRAEGTSPISHVASRLLCAGPAEHSLRWSCRTCQRSCGCTAGTLNAPLPASATGPHSGPWTTPRPLPASAPGTLPIAAP